MGLIKASIGAIGGTLADQWKDFFTVPADIEPTAALFPAVLWVRTQVADRIPKPRKPSSRMAPKSLFRKAMACSSSRRANSPRSQLTQVATSGTRTTELTVSLRRDKWSTSLVKQSWERFKFGGRPGSQQLALFVTLKELPNNRFGTHSEIYWDDAYLNAQVGVATHGTYTVTIVDPIVFAKQFVPATYLQTPAVFDFTDRKNAAASQLFSEVVGSLAAAFSSYTNDADREHRITKIQQDSIGFAASLSQAVENAYRWRANRGLAISNVTILGIEYDEATKALLETVQRADALAGTRGNANLQASVAAGMEAAGEDGGAEGILGLGIAGGSVGLESLMQPQTPPAEGSGAGAQAGQDLVTTLEGLKRALDAGLIEQAEYDAAKAKALGLYRSATPPLARSG